MGSRNHQQKRITLIIQHYLQLLSHHRRLVGKILLWVTLITLVLSMLLLIIMPKYTATSSVVMLPTDPELAFTRGWVGSSQYNPTAFMAQTQVEYLLSMPVAKVTLDQLMAEYAKEMADVANPGGLRGLMTSAVKSMRYAYFWTWNTLNYGKYIPLTTYESYLALLRKGTKVEVVEGSFVMQISVTLPDAKLAARAANVLADAYQKEIAREFSMSGTELQGFFDREIARRQAVVDSLVNQEINLGRELGVLSLNEQKAALQAAMDSELTALTGAQVDLAQLESKVAALKDQIGKVTQQDLLAQMDEDLAMQEVQRQVLQRSVTAHRANLDDFNRQLEDLAAKAQPLQAVTLKRENAEANLQDLVQRKLDVYLSTYASLSEVRTISPAIPPKYPSSPEILVYTIIAFIAGLFISIFLLIAIDSTSEAVKTFPDLFNVTGQRALAFIHPAMSAQARGRPLRFLKRFDFLSGGIPDLVHRLSGRGAAPESPLDIVCFGGRQVGVDAAVTLCVTLAKEGKRVVCSLPEGVPAPTLPADVAGLVDFGPGAAQAPGAVYLRLDTATTPWDRLHGDSSQGFICALKAGLFSEDRLAGFRDEAREAGQDKVDFILVAD